MMTLAQLEPFGCGFLGAQGGTEEKIAAGLRLLAEHVPLRVTADSFFASPDMQNAPIGVTYRYNCGISVRESILAREREEYPHLAADLEAMEEKLRPLDTERLVFSHLTEEERKLAGRIPCGERAVRVCWGGTWIGHSNPDYGMLLRLGTSGLRRRLETGRQMNPGKDAFYNALALTADALDALGARARRLASEAGNDRIARAFEQIPENPPRDFFEACQFFWLVFAFDGVDSPGRFDYFMDDWCASASEADRRACLEALWDLFYETRTWNLCVGGSDEHGVPFENALTRDILRTARKKRVNTPNLTLRVCAATSPEVWRLAAEALATGIGIPAIYSDECVCPALEDLGIPPRDAHNYCMNGCNQIDIFGKSHMGLEDGEVCLAKCLELTLHRGRCALTGEMLGIDTGDIASFATYEELFAAYRRQLEAMTDRVVAMANRAQRLYAEYAPNPLRSLLIRGCVENGRDYKDGGPLYNHGQILAEGIADTADSLTALRRAVYEEKKYTLSDVVRALDADFTGYEEMLRDLAACPQCGNGDAEADGTAAAVVGHFYGYLLTKRTWRGGIYGGGCSTFNRAAAYGGSIGALPNGKRKNDPLLADSIGAVPGHDRNGPTALLLSAARQPQRLAKSGNVLNLKFTRQFFDSEAGESAFISLAKTYFRLGGQQLSVSVVSPEELRDAQLHPEAHGDLIVRVGGYSDHFTNLSRGLQDNIIARTELGL